MVSPFEVHLKVCGLGSGGLGLSLRLGLAKMVFPTSLVIDSQVIYMTPSLWNVSNDERSFWSTLDRSGSATPSAVSSPFSRLSKTRRTKDGNGSNKTLRPSCFIRRSALTNHTPSAKLLLIHTTFYSSTIQTPQNIFPETCHFSVTFGAYFVSNKTRLHSAFCSYQSVKVCKCQFC